MNYPSLQGNWVDFVIILIVGYFAIEASKSGFWAVLADFVSFFLSLLIALRGYQVVAQILRANFSLSHSISNAVGFLLTAIVVETVLGYLIVKIVLRLPKKWHKSRWNKFLAAVPAVGESFVLIAFFLTFAMGLPIAPSIKNDISSSKVGGLLISKTSGVEKRLNEVFGGVIEDALTYLTVKPGSSETVSLNIQSQDLAVDKESEADMVVKINEERRKVGLSDLVVDERLVDVARAHAKDMWEKAYFSHYTPEGKDVGDRLDKAKITYSFAGENLALAPTLNTAHSGLMNSEGHKANILESKFKKVGIGVIDNGFYGKMFVQVFTN